VTGLLTGGDLVKQLRGKELGQELLLSATMFKAGEDLFLDDFTVKMVEQELNVSVTKVENDGGEFLNALLGIKRNK
jgi:NifB/MoaA-like Fe-S oxidoreductase